MGSSNVFSGVLLYWEFQGFQKMRPLSLNQLDGQMHTDPNKTWNCLLISKESVSKPVPELIRSMT